MNQPKISSDLHTQAAVTDAAKSEVRATASVYASAEGCEPTYFASDASGSQDRMDAVAAGLVCANATYYQLQRNDSCRTFHCDLEAIAAALSDAARGDLYARTQLALSVTDLEVAAMGAACVI